MYFNAVCLCMNVGQEHWLKITIWVEMSYLVKVCVLQVLFCVLSLPEYNLGEEIIWCAIL